MKVKFDVTKGVANYGRALGAMSKLSRLDPEQILRAEGAIIIKTCFSRTEQATAADIRQSARLRTLRGMNLTKAEKVGDVSINAGVKRGAAFGRVWVKTASGKYQLVFGDNFSKLDRTFNDADYANAWEKSQAARKAMNQNVRKALKSAGLARQSWVLIGDSMGVRLETVQGGGRASSGAISKARRAMATGGRNRTNGASRMQRMSGGTLLTMINRLPYGDRLKFQPMIDSVMAGRTYAFGMAVKKGYDGSLTKTLKSFPGWLVKY